MEAQYGELLRKLALAQEHVQQLANHASGPRLISRTDPEYPLEARKAGLEGKVELVYHDRYGWPLDRDPDHARLECRP